MRKVNTRGIKQANKCMLMAACAHNLKKLLKYGLQPTAKSVFKTLNKAEKSIIKSLNRLFYFPIPPVALYSHSESKSINY